jgi:hypothetical protein
MIDFPEVIALTYLRLRFLVAASQKPKHGLPNFHDAVLL